MLFGNVIFIKKSGGDGSKFPVTEKSITIGKSEDCLIRIQNPQVSDKHCQLIVDENSQAKIRNLSNSNPTILNNKPLGTGEFTLNHGDVFKLGERLARWEYLATSKFYQQPLSSSGRLVAVVMPQQRSTEDHASPSTSVARNSPVTAGSGAIKRRHSEKLASSLGKKSLTGKSSPSLEILKTSANMAKLLTKRHSLQAKKALFSPKARHSTIGLVRAKTPKTPKSDKKTAQSPWQVKAATPPSGRKSKTPGSKKKPSPVRTPIVKTAEKGLKSSRKSTAKTPGLNTILEASPKNVKSSPKRTPIPKKLSMRKTSSPVKTPSKSSSKKSPKVFSAQKTPSHSKRMSKIVTPIPEESPTVVNLSSASSTPKATPNKTITKKTPGRGKLFTDSPGGLNKDLLKRLLDESLSKSPKSSPARSRSPQKSPKGSSARSKTPRKTPKASPARSSSPGKTPKSQVKKTPGTKSARKSRSTTKKTPGKVKSAKKTPVKLQSPERSRSPIKKTPGPSAEVAALKLSGTPNIISGRRSRSASPQKSPAKPVSSKKGKTPKKRQSRSLSPEKSPKRSEVDAISASFDKLLATTKDLKRIPPRPGTKTPVKSPIPIASPGKTPFVKLSLNRSPGKSPKTPHGKRTSKTPAASKSARKQSPRKSPAAGKTPRGKSPSKTPTESKSEPKPSPRKSPSKTPGKRSPVKTPATVKSQSPSKSLEGTIVPSPTKTPSSQSPRKSLAASKTPRKQSPVKTPVKTPAATVTPQSPSIIPGGDTPLRQSPKKSPAPSKTPTSPQRSLRASSSSPVNKAKTPQKSPSPPRRKTELQEPASPRKSPEKTLKPTTTPAVRMSASPTRTPATARMSISPTKTPDPRQSASPRKTPATAVTSDGTPAPGQSTSPRKTPITARMSISTPAPSPAKTPASRQSASPRKTPATAKTISPRRSRSPIKTPGKPTPRKTPKKASAKKAATPQRGAKRKLSPTSYSAERAAKKLKISEPIKPDKNKKAALLVLGKATRKQKPLPVLIKQKIVKKAILLSTKGKKPAVLKRPTRAAKPVEPVETTPAPKNTVSPARKSRIHFSDVKSDTSADLSRRRTGTPYPKKSLKNSRSASSIAFLEVIESPSGLKSPSRSPSPKKAKSSTPKPLKLDDSSVQSTSPSPNRRSSKRGDGDVSGSVALEVLKTPKQIRRSSSLVTPKTKTPGIIKSSASTSKISKRKSVRFSSKNDFSEPGNSSTNTLEGTTFDFESLRTPNITTDVFVSPLSDKKSRKSPKEFFKNLVASRKSPRNDLTDVKGVREVMRRKSPKNDLRDVKGVREVLKRKSPKNDLRDVEGVREIMRRKSPKNDLTDLTGVRQVLIGKSPRNDLRKVKGIKRIFGKSPVNDLSNVQGVRTLFNTSPNNLDVSMTGVSKLFESPVKKSPKKKLQLDQPVQISLKKLSPRRGGRSPGRKSSPKNSSPQRSPSPKKGNLQSPKKELQVVPEDRHVHFTPRDEPSKPARGGRQSRVSTAATRRQSTRRKPSESEDVIVEEVKKPAPKRKVTKTEEEPEPKFPKRGAAAKKATKLRSPSKSPSPSPKKTRSAASTAATKQPARGKSRSPSPKKTRGAASANVGKAPARGKSKSPTPKKTRSGKTESASAEPAAAKTRGTRKGAAAKTQKSSPVKPDVKSPASSPASPRRTRGGKRTSAKVEAVKKAPVKKAPAPKRNTRAVATKKKPSPKTKSPAKSTKSLPKVQIGRSQPNRKIAEKPTKTESQSSPVQTRLKVNAQEKKSPKSPSPKAQKKTRTTKAKPAASKAKTSPATTTRRTTRQNK